MIFVVLAIKAQTNIGKWITGFNQELRIMMSSNGNKFRVTGHLCGEFTGHGEFPAQRPVTRRFDVFFYLCLNKRSNTQSSGWWFETPSCSLWRHCNGYNQSRPVDRIYCILNMLNCFNCLKDHQRCIHISYDISYFVSRRRLNSHLSNTTCCLPFAVNTMPADALFLKIVRAQIGIVLTTYTGIFRLWHQ